MCCPMDLFDTIRSSFFKTVWRIMEELNIYTINNLITVEQAAEELTLEPDTVYKYIKRGKLKSTKVDNERIMIDQKEVERLLDEKKLQEEEIKDHFSLKELEMMGISRDLVIKGDIDSKIVERKHYVHFEEAKRHLKTQNCQKLTSMECEETLIVINRGGLHFRPIAKIIEIGTNHLNKGLSLRISYKSDSWLFPSKGTLELLSLGVYRGESVLVHTEGPGAIFCMRDIRTAFKKGFYVKY